MDKIVLKNLAFYGYHGLMPEEQVIGQKFFVDLELFLDLHRAGVSDDVKETVNYAQVYQTVKDVVEKERYHLLEGLAEALAGAIFKRFGQVEQVVVRIRKPEAPVPGIFDYFGIEIKRRRNVTAYLGLGSNLGDKKANIHLALELLKNHEEIKVTKVSSLYETEPEGYTDQNWFLNAVVEIETSLSPYSLLRYCNFIEKVLKRERTIKWGPRVIDVDILLYGDFSCDEEVLTIPHPHMLERTFVMIPLYEIAPGLVIQGKSIKDIVASLTGKVVRKVD